MEKVEENVGFIFRIITLSFSKSSRERHAGKVKGKEEKDRKCERITVVFQNRRQK